MQSPTPSPEAAPSRCPSQPLHPSPAGEAETTCCQKPTESPTKALAAAEHEAHQEIKTSGRRDQAFREQTMRTTPMLPTLCPASWALVFVLDSRMRIPSPRWRQSPHRIPRTHSFGRQSHRGPELVDGL